MHCAECSWRWQFGIRVVQKLQELLGDDSHRLAVDDDMATDKIHTVRFGVMKDDTPCGQLIGEGERLTDDLFHGFLRYGGLFTVHDADVGIDRICQVFLKMRLAIDCCYHAAKDSMSLCQLMDYRGNIPNGGNHTTVLKKVPFQSEIILGARWIRLELNPHTLLVLGQRVDTIRSPDLNIWIFCWVEALIVPLLVGPEKRHIVSLNRAMLLGVLVSMNTT